MQTPMTSTPCLLKSQLRYTLLLESLAWDILSLLKQHQGMFALESRFHHHRPSNKLKAASVNNSYYTRHTK